MELNCPKCEGAGEVYEIEDPKNGVWDEHYYECPLCNGTGILNIKAAKQPNAFEFGYAPGYGPFVTCSKSADD